MAARLKGGVGHLKNAMYCDKCGATNLETSSRCVSCGHDLLENYRSTDASGNTTPSKETPPRPSAKKVLFFWFIAIAVSVATALSVGGVPKTVGGWVALVVFGPFILMFFDWLFNSGKSEKKK